ncbi:MAG: adenylate/guanylate cyclase domain-containing protein [Anaerolineales bacterium]
MSEIEKVEQAIQALEAQRAVIGDEVVDSALGPLREKLAAMLSAISASQPSGKIEDARQRRIITVLLADMSGFTAISANQDAEDVRDMMHALWERLDGVVLAHGGRIDKHLGDGVMALWGADESREDDPDRAVRCALVMQAEIAQFHPALQLASDLKIRIGLNTGPVLIGSIGARGEITAVGDTINLGARLEQACPPGGILISHDTYQHVRGVFGLEPQAPLELTGRPEPVQTYLVKYVKPRAFRLETRGVEGVETRMVGRDLEMEQIKNAFNAAFLQNSLQITGVLGDAGLGKSRLLNEFSAWADLQETDWWWFKGRASLSMNNAPYALLRDIFSFRFEIYDNDSLIVAHEKLEAGFRQFLPDDDHALEKAHVIGHLLGFNFSSSFYLRGLLRDPQQIRQQALHYLTQFFRDIPARRPVLLMIDDLHWADTGSLDMLSSLFENLPPSLPLMALMVARPMLYERYPKWGQNFPAFHSLKLEPLGKDDSRRLVHEILQKVPDLPSAVLELVVGGADGNPFYLEELIKMLIDAQVIQTHEDAWRVDLSRLAAVHVPQTLTEVIQSRLDNLPPFERATLQLASVVGRVFWDQAVIELKGSAEEGQILGALERLKHKELIFERQPSAFAGAREYTFKHHLLREVAYNAMLKRQRATCHFSAGDWLVRASGERRVEYLPQIAEHFEKGGDPGRAATVLAEAAERALSLSALAEARSFFEHAIDLSGHQEHPAREVVAMQLGLTETNLQLGDYIEAQDHAEKAVSMAVELKIDALVADAFIQLGQIASFQGTYQEARSYLSAGLVLARENNVQSTLGRVLVTLGAVEWHLGNLRQAQAYCIEGHEIAQTVGDNVSVMRALNCLGVVAGALGHPEEEEDYYQRVFKLAVFLGHRERASVALNNLGEQAGEQNQWQKAWDYHMRSLETLRETGAQAGLPMREINLGRAGIRLGRMDDARQYLRAGAARARRMGATPILVPAVIYFALLAYIEGDVERALQLLGVAKTSPAYDSEAEREINLLLAEWQLDPQRVQTGLASGAQLTLDAVLDELLRAD